MTTAVSLLILAAAVAFVAWPFFRVAEADREGEAVNPMERQKLDAYAAIKEAEFDFRMDKLSPSDFAALERRYRQQALAAIAALEKSRPREKADKPRAAGKSGFAFCPSCGGRLPARANYCGACGRGAREAV